ncbi:hypothetical protein Y032_0081g1455 [Ancylostoma ceylanicum]|uniref:Uncharacterized protein n=1 Tax=Ancylostoma ceylanicum TaxID=53326 RepID=A0A016TS45_9BILA|nr:hypothetical protein Y032_0081g1455 [Ancylostoma ceylanicum]
MSFTAVIMLHLVMKHEKSGNITTKLGRKAPRNSAPTAEYNECGACGTVARRRCQGREWITAFDAHCTSHPKCLDGRTGEHSKAARPRSNLCGYTIRLALPPKFLRKKYTRNRNIAFVLYSQGSIPEKASKVRRSTMRVECTQKGLKNSKELNLANEL